MLVLASVIWGGSFVVIKDNMDYVTPMWQLVYRLLVASVGGAVLLVPRLKYICKKYIFQGVILGVIFASALIPQNYGASLTTASKCAFLTVSYVAFVPIIGVLFLRQPLTIKKAVSVVVCMVGVGLITLTEKLTIQKGDVYLIITGIAYALHLIWIDKCNSNNSDGDKRGVLIIHILQIWTALIVALVAALILEPFNISGNSGFALGIIYCGIFEVLVGFLLQFKGQQNTNPSLAGIILSTECVFAGIFGVIFQNNVFSLKMAVGCAMIFLSAVIEALNFERRIANGA